MSGDALIVVAPAAVDFSDARTPTRSHAFEIPQTRACISPAERGIGALPVGARDLRIFNIQGRGYPNDNGVVRFVRDHDLAYEVKTKLD